MLIPASRFSTLPEGCPVLWGDTPAVILGRHGATEYRIQIPGRFPSTTAVGASQLRVALDSPAAVRAFAPALTCAVKGLPNAPKHPPAVVLDDDYGGYTLIELVQTSDDGLVARRLFVGTKGIYAATPEACLLNGLKAALDAACVAVGGAS